MGSTFYWRESGPEAGALLVRLGSLLFLLLGAVQLVLAFAAPPEQDEWALKLADLGVVSLAIGVAIAGGYWVFRRTRGKQA